jgi:hypothetical protein
MCLKCFKRAYSFSLLAAIESIHATSGDLDLDMPPDHGLYYSLFSKEISFEYFQKNNEWLFPDLQVNLRYYAWQQ